MNFWVENITVHGKAMSLWFIVWKWFEPAPKTVQWNLSIVIILRKNSTHSSHGLDVLVIWSLVVKRDIIWLVFITTSKVDSDVEFDLTTT